MIDAVFDTNIFLQAILSEAGPADACLQLVFNKRVRLVTTAAILQELETVITRPSLIAKYSKLRTERPRQLIDKIYSKAIVIEQSRRIYKFERDRTDEIFINLALTWGADYLVSRDKDLLDLRLDSEFSSQFPELRIVTPVGFLKVVSDK